MMSMPVRALTVAAPPTIEFNMYSSAYRASKSRSTHTEEGATHNQRAKEGVEGEKQVRRSAEPRLDNFEEGVGAIGVHLDFRCDHGKDSNLNGSADAVPPVLRRCEHTRSFEA